MELELELVGGTGDEGVNRLDGTLEQSRRIAVSDWTTQSQ